MTLIVKVRLDEDIRRFRLEDLNISFDDLRGRVSELYATAPHKFYLTFTDDEGDLCRITNDDTLEEALALSVRTEQTVLRMTAHIIENAPDEPPSADSSADFERFISAVREAESLMAVIPLAREHLAQLSLPEEKAARAESILCLLEESNCVLPSEVVIGIVEPFGVPVFFLHPFIQADGTIDFNGVFLTTRDHWLGNMAWVQKLMRAEQGGQNDSSGGGRCGWGGQWRRGRRWGRAKGRNGGGRGGRGHCWGHGQRPRASHTSGPAFGMSFVSDATIADGTPIEKGERFVKIWQILNSGTEAWPAGTRAVHVGGSDMRAPAEGVLVANGQEVPAGEEIGLPIELQSGEQDGREVSYWRLCRPSGERFGDRLWVAIYVVGDDRDGGESSGASSEEEEADEDSRTIVIETPGLESQPEEEEVVEEVVETPVVAPFRFQEQFESLVTMGFPSTETLRQLLIVHNGAVPLVVRDLLS